LVGVTLVVTVVVALALPVLVVMVLVVVAVGAASAGPASSPSAATEAISAFIGFLLVSRRYAGMPLHLGAASSRARGRKVKWRSRGPRKIGVRPAQQGVRAGRTVRAVRTRSAGLFRILGGKLRRLGIRLLRGLGGFVLSLAVGFCGLRGWSRGGGHGEGRGRNHAQRCESCDHHALHFESLRGFCSNRAGAAAL